MKSIRVLVLSLVALIGLAPVAMAANGLLTEKGKQGWDSPTVYRITVQTTTNLATATQDSILITLPDFSPLYDTSGKPVIPIQAMAKLSAGTGAAGDSIHVGVELDNTVSYTPILPTTISGAALEATMLHINAVHTSIGAVKSIQVNYIPTRKVKLWVRNVCGSSRTYIVTVWFGIRRWNP